MIQVAPKLTPLSADTVAVSMCEAYRRIFTAELSRGALCSLMAQSALETGQWRKLYCNNFGNEKPGPSYAGEIYMLRCNEIIAGKVEWFDPPHLQTWFRAFATPTAGIESHLRFLGTATRPGKPNRYAHAWDAAIEGNVRGFVDELATAGYFTANVDQYRAGCVALYVKFQRSLPDEIGVCHDPISSEPLVIPTNRSIFTDADFP